MDKRPASPSRAGSPGGKKQRSESEAQSRKVGIVCHSKTDGDGIGEYEVQIYVIDLDLQSSHPCGTLVTEYPDVDPVVTFIFPKSYGIFAVCVLNSTVYMFEGCNTLVPGQIPQNSARKFVLSEEVLADKNCVVMEEKIEKITPMYNRKGYPSALPTPVGKNILVFGNCFNVDKSSEEFELYDPEMDKWERLPGLPWSTFWDVCFDVKCYSFIGESHFVLVTNEVYSLPVSMHGYFVAAKGRYALSSLGIGFDIGDGQFLSYEPWCHLKLFEKFPLSTFASPNSLDLLPLGPAPSIIPLHPIVQGEGEAEDGEVCNTCILRLELDDFEARLLLDVCHTDLTTFKTGVSKYVSLRIYFLDNLFSLYLISL